MKLVLLRANKDWRIGFFILTCAFFLLINLGSYGVLETSDARYAEIAREMFESGDYMHPRLMNILHYHKPPLTYQITALSYRIFGVNAFAARFGVQLAILLQLFLIYKLTLQLFNNKDKALWAAIIYFSFPIVLIASRNLTTDPYLTTFSLWSVYAWTVYSKKGRVIYLYWFSLALALGFLAKGPVIFIVPLVFVIAVKLFQTKKYTFSWHHVLSSLLFLALGGSWFIYLMVINSDFIYYFVGHHTVERFSSNVFERSQPFWFYLALAPVLGAPLLILIPFLIKQQWVKFKCNTNLITLGISISIPLLFFSLASSKLIPYILPIFPMIAILLAHMYGESNNHRKKYHYTINGYSILIATCLCITPFLNRWITFDIPWQFLIPGVIITIWLLIHKRLYKWAQKSALLITLFLTSCGLLWSASLFIAHNELGVNSTVPLAEIIRNHKLENRPIYVYNRRLPSLAFNLQTDIVSVFDGHSSLNREVQFETDTLWKHTLINLNNTAELEQLKSKLENKSVMVVHKNLPEKRKWFESYFSQHEQVGKWHLFY